MWLRTKPLCMKYQGHNLDVHRNMFLQNESLRMKDQGHNLVGKHYGCYQDGVASNEKSNKNEHVG